MSDYNLSLVTEIKGQLWQAWVRATARPHRGSLEPPSLSSLQIFRGAALERRQANLLGQLSSSRPPVEIAEGTLHFPFSGTERRSEAKGKGNLCVSN